MKQCFKCKQEKPLSDFYRHPQMKDGRVNKCKECNKVDVRENRKDRIEYYRAYDRERGNRQDAEYRKRYRERNPIKYGAHCMVANAVQEGRLAKSDICESDGCEGSERLHGHHDDYSRPMDVRWLCAACHHEWHKENGQGLNG